jgi:hypothetical protein
VTTWNRVKDILRVYIDLLIAILVTVAGIVAIVTSNFGLTSDKVVPSLTLAVLFAISISILRDRISDRATAQSLRLVSESVRQRVFVRDDEPYEQLMKYIRGHRVRKVTLIQYSGNQSMGILTAALDQYNVNAELYLQHEDTAKNLGSERQADLIASSIRGKLSDLSGNIKERGSSLKVYRVTAPISLRAIKIDNEVLCMGWYTFEPEDRSGRPQYRGDKIAVSGHDRPTIIAWRGTADFEALVVMFDAMVKIYRDANNELPL